MSARVYMWGTQTRTLIINSRLTYDLEIKEDRIALLYEEAKENQRTQGKYKWVVCLFVCFLKKKEITA